MWEFNMRKIKIYSVVEIKDIVVIIRLKEYKNFE